MAKATLERYPRFIDISASKADHLNNKPHHKTARAIVQYIQSDPPNKLIGLSGSWGSGKSTIVNIIGDLLHETTHLFIFDAWAHQEDLQRKAFLQELTANLISNRKIDAGKWNDKMMPLLTKQKTTVQKDIPHLPTVLLLVFIAFTLIPIFTAVGRVIPNSKPWWWSVLVTLVPFIFIVLLLIWAWLKNMLKSTINLLAVFRGKEIDSVKHEVTLEEEPSIADFKQWMSDLSDDLQEQLIIVFDNMDRVPAEKMKLLWSSIHTFFSGSPYAKITAIVPFDKIQISKAFDVKGQGEKEIEIEMVDGFIEKTFSAMFYTSTPIITDWKLFFEEKCKEAFGHIESGDLFVISSIFQLHYPKVTPRKIIYFINELVSLELTWGTTIDRKYMALYVVNKEAFQKDPFNEIIRNRYNDKSASLIAANEEMENAIASLVFNIPIDQSIEFIQVKFIQTSFSEGNTENLDQLVSHSKFAMLLSEVVTHLDGSMDNLVTCLLHIDNLEKSAHLREAIIQGWKALINKQLTQKIPNYRLTDTLRTFIIKDHELALKLNVVKYLCYQYYEERRSIEAYYGSLDELRTFCKKKKIAFPFKEWKEFHSLTPEQFTDLINWAKGDFYEYGFTVDEKLLETYLITLLKSEDARYIDFHFVRKGLSLPMLEEEATKFLHPANISLGHIAKLFSTFRYLAAELPISQRLDDGFIDDLLRATTQESPAFIYLAAMKLSQNDRMFDWDEVKYNVLQEIPADILKAIVKELPTFITFNQFLAVALRDPNPNPLVGKALNEWLFNGELTESIHLYHVLSKIQLLQALLGTPFDIVLDKLNDFFEPLDENFAHQLIDVLVPDVTLFNTYAAHREIVLADSLIEKMLGNVKTISAEHWIVLFDKNSFSYELECLYWSLQKELLPDLPDSFKEAVKQFISLVSTGQRPGQRMFWQRFIVDRSEFLTGLALQIRDHYIATISIDADQFLNLELVLRLEGDLLDRAEEVTAFIINRVIVSQEASTVISQHAPFYVSIVEKATVAKNDMLKHLQLELKQSDFSLELKNFTVALFHTLLSKVVIGKAVYRSKEPERPVELEAEKDMPKEYDVTETLRNRIYSDKQSQFTIGNDLAPRDPHSRVLKELAINYEINGDKKEVVIEEHQEAFFPLLLQ